MKSKKFKVCVKVEASTIPVALEMEGTRGEAKEDNEHWEEICLKASDRALILCFSDN